MRQKQLPAGKESLAEDYPGLEQPIVAAEALFKFKGQSVLYEDSPPGSIRSAPGAAAMTEIGVYNMSQEALPTFREGPLNAAVSIAPRSRLGRNQSSLAPGDADRMMRGESSYEELSRSQSQASFAFADGRPYSSIDRTRSALAYSDPATQRLMERSGSSMSQYDAQVSRAFAQFVQFMIDQAQCCCIQCQSARATA